MARTQQKKNSLSVLDPEHLAPIRNLRLRARQIVEGTMAGMHKSPYHGFSVEFLEYRPYNAGESTRRIDWRKYAKTERTVVRLFEDETNLRAQIILDSSASMAYGSGAMTKFEYARTLAASLAWILIRQRDAVGLTVFDESVHTSIPPKSANVQLKTILGTLSAITPSKQTRCADALDTIAHTVNRRGLSIVLSDLFDDPENVIHGLRHLHFKRQDILVLWILDPDEIGFKHDSPLELIDSETGKKMVLDGKVAKYHIQNQLAQFRKKIETACRELRIDMQLVTTNQPFHTAIMKIIQKRGRLF